MIFPRTVIPTPGENSRRTPGSMVSCISGEIIKSLTITYGLLSSLNLSEPLKGPCISVYEETNETTTNNMANILNVDDIKTDDDDGIAMVR